MILCFLFQAEDGIRDLVRSRGLGDVYKRQPEGHVFRHAVDAAQIAPVGQRYSEVVDVSSVTV